MTAWTKFERYSEDVTRGNHHFGSDTFKVMLTNVAPVASTGAVFADITDISAGNGYSAGGTTMGSATISRSGGTTKVVFSNVVFTASGGTIGPFRYTVFYNDTTSSPAKPLVGFSDNGSSITLNSGDDFTVSFDATNGFEQVT